MSDALRSPGTRARSRSGRRPLAALAGIVLLVVIQQTERLSGGLLAEAVTNAAHIPMFAAMTVLVAVVLGRRPWWRLLLVVIAIAVGTELLQALTPRSASVVDVGRDMLGALPALGALELRAALRRRGRRRPGLIPWTAAAALLVVLFAAAPARILSAYAERDRLFPELLRPDWAEGPLVESGGTMTRIVAAPADWQGHAGEPALELVWADGRYPGITLREVVPVWDAFNTLEVDVYLPEGPPMPLTAALGHEGTEGTARHLRRIVLPGAQRLRYPLGPLLNPVADGPVRVAKLILHTNRSQRGRTLLLGGVRLTAEPVRNDIEPRHEPGNAGNLVSSE